VQFAFGDYSLDTNRRELTRGSELISIGPQVFDLLAYLVQNRERVVSKDDLIEYVWGGRIVSDSTLTSHVNAVRKAIGDSGEQQNFIRTIPRKGIRFIGEIKQPDRESETTRPSTSPTLALPDRPSIAVLPFENMSGDPEQEYFADGVVEDIITALSRIRWLFVIARNSSFAYKGRAVDAKTVGRELGVRYIVEGGVRRAANRVRITTQLIDATFGAHIWADRFDGTLDDIFDIQDQVATSVVGAITRRLEQAEIERSKRKPTENLDAYDLFLRAMASFYQRTSEGNSGALKLFYRAIQLDENFASAYAMASWCYTRRKISGWMSDRTQEAAEGTRLARRAVELGSDDAIALARSGHSLAHLAGELDSGIMLVDRALVLNPNLAAAWFLGAWLRVFHGEPEAAIERFAQAMRLSPLDPELYRMQAGMASAHFLAGRFDDALSWAEKSFSELPTYLPAIAIVAMSYALAGRMEEARRAIQKIREVDPAFCLSNLTTWYPLRRPEDVTRFTEALRKAGMPE